MAHDTDTDEPSGGSYHVDAKGRRTLVHRTRQAQPAPEAPPAPPAAAIEPAKSSTRTKGE